MLKRILLAAALAGLMAVPAASALAPQYAWHDTPTGSQARLRGLSAVSRTTAWASGSLGTVLRTTNRGATWQDVGPPETESLQFRDIEAFDANRAVILSIGEGTDSRIYHTSNGGLTWQLVFVNQEPTAFYDCMTFLDKRRGLALSDPPDGQHFRILATEDYGFSWHIVAAQMPQALPGEFAFAASGQCITSTEGRTWFATGGSTQARVFRSADAGRTWAVSPTPIASGPTAGIFALAFRDFRTGLAVGGDFAAPTNSPDNFARTRDAGVTWNLLPAAPPEYRSGAAWLDWRTAFAVGPSGSDFTADAGTSWTRFDDGSLDTVDCVPPTACWASGENGRVAYLVRTG